MPSDQPYGSAQGGIPPPGGGFPPPPPQPPKQSGSPLLIVILGGVLVVVLAIVAVVLVIALRDDEEPAAPDPPTTGGGGGGNDGDAYIGDTVSRSQLEFTVTRVERGVSIPGESPSGEFVVAYITVENVSSSETDFWSDEQVLYDSSGGEYNFDRAAHNALGQNEVSEYVSPGQSLQAAVVFDVPNADDLTHIGLSEETFGGEEVNVEIAGGIVQASGGGGQETPADAEMAGGIGDTVSRDRLEFTVTEVETDVDIDGETPDGEFIIVNIDVRNHTSDVDSESFWSDEQNIYLQDGTEVGFDREAHEAYGQNDVDEYLDAGQSLEAAVVFDVPSADEVSYIGLSEETFGGNEINVDLSDM